MLRRTAGGEMIDHRESRGIDHVDLAGLQVGRVDAGQGAGDGRAEIAGASLRINVDWIDQRRALALARRQGEDIGRPKLEGGLADEILPGAAMLDEGLAEGGALAGGHAIGRDRQRLGMVNQAVRAENGEKGQREQPKKRGRHSKTIKNLPPAPARDANQVAG
jgi:hypothetical protein